MKSQSTLSVLPAQKPNATIVALLKGSAVPHSVLGSGCVTISLGGVELTFDKNGELHTVVSQNEEAA